MAGRNLALFLDGTWNDPDDNTNVWQLRNMLAKRSGSKVQEKPYYDKGVGTARFERLRGGAFAKGLSKNVMQAYEYLMKNYQKNDEIFIFGFSRGAFTARSLAGMIAKCGLLQSSAPMSVEKVFDLYERAEKLRPLYQLEFDKREGKTDFSSEEKTLLEFSTRIPIKFIGIWDTVGTDGIPFVNQRARRFHHTRMSVIFKNVAHALAIDEHRKPYMQVPIYDYIPDDENAAETRREAFELAKRVEQRWFSGAHSNIGGGYENDQLANIPLGWMMKKAEACGLKFKKKIKLSGTEHKEPIIDSYSEFLWGAYKYLLSFGKRYYRTIGAPAQKRKGGSIIGINEVIDASVVDRWKNDVSYRPKNLVDWEGRSGTKINDMNGDIKLSG